MQELNRHFETNIITPKMEIDEITLFNTSVINYITENDSHILSSGIGGISVIISKDDWQTFLDNLYTIHYRRMYNSDPIEIREKLDPTEFKRTYLYQMGYRHQPIGFRDYSMKFLDVKTLQKKLNWKMIINKIID